MTAFLFYALLLTNACRKLIEVKRGASATDLPYRRNENNRVAGLNECPEDETDILSMEKMSKYIEKWRLLSALESSLYGEFEKLRRIREFTPSSIRPSNIRGGGLQDWDETD